MIQQIIIKYSFSVWMMSVITWMCGLGWFWKWRIRVFFSRDEESCISSGWHRPQIPTVCICDNCQPQVFFLFMKVVKIKIPTQWCVKIKKTTTKNRSSVCEHCWGPIDREQASPCRSCRSACHHVGGIISMFLRLPEYPKDIEFILWNMPHKQKLNELN